MSRIGPFSSIEFERLDGSLIVRVAGEIDRDQSHDLGATIRRQLRPTDTALLLNLACVTFCGSSGLAFLVELQAHADRSGVPFAVINPSSIIKAMIAVCGLHDTVRTWSDERSASLPA